MSESAFCLVSGSINSFEFSWVNIKRPESSLCFHPLSLTLYKSVSKAKSVEFNVSSKNIVNKKIFFI